MRSAVKSLILTWATVSLVSFGGLIYVFPGYSLDNAFSETFRKHPGPEGSFWFHWCLTFLVVGILMTFWSAASNSQLDRDLGEQSIES
jgi:hypothetical protein